MFRFLTDNLYLSVLMLKVLIYLSDSQLAVCQHIREEQISPQPSSCMMEMASSEHTSCWLIHHCVQCAALHLLKTRPPTCVHCRSRPRDSVKPIEFTSALLALLTKVARPKRHIDRRCRLPGRASRPRLLTALACPRCCCSSAAAAYSCTDGSCPAGTAPRTICTRAARRSCTSVR